MRLIDAEQCPCNNCILPLDDRIGCFIFPCKEFGEWYGHPVYDVDKVLEELEYKKALYDINFQGWSAGRYQDAIDIVKKGGVDEYETI